MDEEFDDSIKEGIKQLREDPTLSVEDRQRYEHLLIEKVKVCKQIDEIDQSENPITSKTGSSMAEKHSILRDKLSEVYENIVDELMEYFEVDDQGAEPFAIKSTPSKVLNEMISVYITDQMLSSTRWRRLDRKELDDLVGKLPEEELKLLPDQSSNTYALLVQDINKEICGYQFDSWDESKTMQKRKHEPLNKEEEAEKKRKRLEILEKIMPEWINMPDNEEEEDNASSVGSESDYDENEQGEQEEDDIMEQDQTELPTQSDQNITEESESFETETNEKADNEVQSNSDNLDNSDNTVENLEPTSSSTENRARSTVTLSNHDQFHKLLDQYERDTEELLRAVEEFGDDIEGLSSSSEDEVTKNDQAIENANQ